MEYKNHSEKLECTDIEDEVKIFGYASLFGIEDDHGDIIEKGAFKDSISKPNSIKFLWQHDPKYPIGKINNLYEDEKGLFIDAKINCKLLKGRESALLVKDGAIDGLSIGFTINKSNISKSGGRIISNLKLWEVSIVTFPANNMATISQINKSALSQTIIKIEQSINQLQRSFYGSNDR